MIDGIPVIDVHQHVVHAGSLKMPFPVWAPPQITGVPIDRLYRDGAVDPDAYLASTACTTWP